MSSMNSTTRTRTPALRLLSLLGLLCLLGTQGLWASPAPAHAASAHAASAAARARFKIVNLSRAYQRALPHARAGRVASELYPRGRRPASTPAGNQCTEPCPLTYYGGPVQHNPQVYLLLWGPNWQSDPGQEASANYLDNFYSGLGVQPQDTWSLTAAQYGGDGTQLAAEADALTSYVGITDLADAQVVVATQSGTCPAGFYAPLCGGTGNYCAWHDISSNGETFTNLPYILDAGSGCGENSVQGTDDGFSIVGGHEYAETITDPSGSSWLDENGEEIGDKCAWQDLGTVALSTGTFAMQPLWSNNDFAQNSSGCALSAQAEDTVTVYSPGDQYVTQDSYTSVQIQANSSVGYPLAYNSTGLPPGLFLDSEAGIISGTASGPGDYVVTVVVSDPSGASSSVTFNWTVSAGNPIFGYRGKCVADYQSGLDGAPIVLWRCNGHDNQLWVRGSEASLIVFGECLADPRRGGAGTGLVLKSCTGGAAQHWAHRRGEYVLAANGLCLTDPRRSTRNGTQLVVAACKRAADQIWSGP